MLDKTEKFFLIFNGHKSFVGSDTDKCSRLYFKYFVVPAKQKDQSNNYPFIPDNNVSVQRWHQLLCLNVQYS